TFWSFGGASHGLAVAALATGPVYAASGGGIFAFSTDGTLLGQYPTPAGVMAESLKVTPNGHLLYGNVTGDDRSEIGILGASSLDLDAVPVARFRYQPQPGGAVAFHASASSAG